MTNSDAIERDRQEIRAHIDGLFQAYIRGDREAIRRGHTADWRGFQVQSRHIVRGIDDYMKEADGVLSNFKPTRYEMLDIDIQVHGDIAVVFYMAKDWLRDESGERPLGTLRSVDIYRRENGTWNQSGSNICFLPKENAA
ncbi:MAG: nuclear transport factor 2 family protein [Elusimicrobiales bacterium]|nr:nuclear transport factor 2 family protein [Elusimicrobiales bacterium]